MPQSKIGGQLSDEEIRMVEDWILAGAPDFMGKIVEKPLFLPLIGNSFQIVSQTGVILTDSLCRENKMPYGSILISAGAQLKLIFEALENDIENNRQSKGELWVSKNRSNFDSKIIIHAKYYSNKWEVLIDSNNFTQMEKMYFRFAIPSIGSAIYPDENSPAYIHQTWSFTVTAP